MSITMPDAWSKGDGVARPVEGREKPRPVSRPPLVARSGAAWAG